VSFASGCPTRHEVVSHMLKLLFSAVDRFFLCICRPSEQDN